MSLKKLQETDYLIHCLTGGLNFFGGDFTIEKVSEMPFGEIVDTFLRNGGAINIGIKNKNKIFEENEQLQKRCNKWKI
jgi:hypothetical protein